MQNGPTLIERLTQAWEIAKRLDVLQGIEEKIISLASIVDRIESLKNRLPEPSQANLIVSKLENLDSVVSSIQALGKTQEQKIVKEEPHPAKKDLVQWERLKLLSRFVELYERAEEIEKEWQRIQQDEHDAFFTFQTNSNNDTELRYIYRKGVADGIKWCLNRFS